MNSRDLGKFPRKVRTQLSNICEELGIQGVLCGLSLVGGRIPFVVGVNEHAFKRVVRRLGLYDVGIFLRDIIKVIDNSKELGDLIIECANDARRENREYKKMGLYIEDMVLFIYLHIHDNGYIEIATAVDWHNKYFVDPEAMPVFLNKKGYVIKGFVGILEKSLNTKYNRHND